MTENCISAREDGQRNSAELLVILPAFLLPRSLRWMMSPRSEDGGRTAEAVGAAALPRGADGARPAGGAPAPRQRRSRSPSRGTGPAPPCPSVPLDPALWSPPLPQPSCETLPPAPRRAMVTPPPPCCRAGNGKILLIWGVLSSDGSG